MKRKAWQYLGLLCFLAFFILLVYFTKVRVHVTRYECDDGSITNNPAACGRYAEVIKGQKQSAPLVPSEEKRSTVRYVQAQAVPGPGIHSDEERHARQYAQPPVIDFIEAPPQNPGSSPITHTGRISDSPNAKYDPTVSGNGLAWVEYTEGDADIYFKDLFTETISPVANSKNAEYSPLLSKERVVYLKSPSTKGNVPNEIFLYNTKSGSTTRLVCSEGIKSLLDFKANMLLYKESAFDNNVLLDVHSLEGWDCKSPKRIELPKEENPVSIIWTNLVKVENAHAKYPCRAYNTMSHAVANYSLPCDAADDMYGANETMYFGWYDPQSRTIRMPDRKEAHTGYTNQAQSFVRVSAGRIALELPDVEQSKLQFGRPDHDLVVYDTNTGKMIGITKTMKTKETTISGIVYARNFDLDGNVLAWTDIRRDRTKPEIYVAEIS